MQRPALLATLYGGFIAGTIDIFAAAAINLISPFVIAQAIARGVLGKQEAFSGGAGSAALGVVLQWGMSLIIATIFVFAATRMPILRRRWIAAGVAYGVVVFFVMNYVVVPLSRVGAIPHFTVTTFVLNLLAMLLFGLIVAWYARRYLPAK
jgi:uncharacterized membrane protein YagU involved in acid resistance